MKIKSTSLRVALMAICTLTAGHAAAQWNTVGPTAGPGFNVYALKTMGNDLYAGGDSGSGKGISKWDGTAWTSLGKVVPSYNYSVLGINVLAVYNNELYVGGDLDSVGGVYVNPTIGVTKWNGTTWQTLGTPATNLGSINCMTVYNNELYAGGSSGINKWDGTTWTNVASANSVNAMAVYNGDLYAAGTFNHIGSATMPNGSKGFAKWDGTAWTMLPGFYDTISALPGINAANVANLKVFHGELYAVGGMSYAGTTHVRSAARWNGTSWNDVGGGFIGNGQLSQNCLAIDSNNLYIVGPVQHVNATNDSVYLSAYWNGTKWNAMFGGNAPYMSFNAVENYDNNIYSAWASLVKWTGATDVHNVSATSHTVTLFPNPANGSFHIYVDEKKPLDIKVIGTDGKVVHEQQILHPASDNIIEMANAANGLYFVEISGAGYTLVKRLLVGQ